MKKHGDLLTKNCKAKCKAALIETGSRVHEKSKFVLLEMFTLFNNCIIDTATPVLQIQVLNIYLPVYEETMIILYL